MNSLSYAILCNDEINELTLLLNFLILHIREIDEVCVLLDDSSLAKIDMIQLLKTFQNKYQEKRLTFIYDVNPLNKDFASQKNKLISMCNKDYIFNIDSDEIITEIFIQQLPILLDLNKDTEVYIVPRINTVDGLTQQHIQKWRWSVNEKGWINFPDYQKRIHKNIPEINWNGKVHETLIGYKTYALLPQDENWCLIHKKNIKKQEKQNNFYNTI